MKNTVAGQPQLTICVSQQKVKKPYFEVIVRPKFNIKDAEGVFIMTDNFIKKSGGFALIAGGSLLFAWAILAQILIPLKEAESNFIALVKDEQWIFVASIAFVGILLIIFGLFFSYIFFRTKGGILGFLGFTLAITALIFQISLLTWEIFLYPVLANSPSVSHIFNDKTILNDPAVGFFLTLFSVVTFLGYILFGISIFRTNFFYKISGILMCLGPTLYIGSIFIPFLEAIGAALFAVSLITMGYKLIKICNIE